MAEEVAFLIDDKVFKVTVSKCIEEKIKNDSEYANLLGQILGSQVTDSVPALSSSINNVKVIPSTSTSKESILDAGFWTTETTNLLITKRSDFEKQFNDPKCKKTKLWNLIASEINKIAKINVNGNSCHSKWRNLLATYRKNKDRKKTSGESAIKWPYFDKLDEIYRNKIVNNPSPNMLCSSLPLSPEDSNSSDSVQSSFQQVSSNPINTHTKKRRISNEPPDWIKEYIQNQNEMRERIWNEQKELENKRIQALNELTDVLREYINKI